MLTCEFGGQLGNIILEIYSVFFYAKRHGIPFSEIVFNKRYDVFNESNPPIQYYDYIANNMAVFENIASHFVDEDEFESIYFYQCQQKHILHGDDIDPRSHPNISFRRFDIHYPSSEEDRELFCQLFDLGHLQNDFFKSLIKSYDLENSCAVHVRRTDFKTWYNGKYLETAEQILVKIKNAIKRGNTSFVVFSDDLPWCKDNIIVDSAKITFAQHTGHDYDDLILMANAKEILSGASTFAYCAKLLNKNIPFEEISLQF